jgi:hypothetical protein
MALRFSGFARIHFGINPTLYLNGDRRRGDGWSTMQEKREVRYSVRLPPVLHMELVELARREDRSLHQQILYLLRQGVRQDVQRRERTQAEQ